MSLSIEWTKHISDPKAKKDFEAAVRNSTLALGRLSDILKERESEAMKVKPRDYDNPSWAYKQADDNGYLRCLRELSLLINSIYKG